MASGSHVWLNVARSTSCISSRLLLRHPVKSCQPEDCSSHCRDKAF